ncbi:MAG TPA: carbohydrate porin, partial [Humisphaera sp.]
MTTARPVLAAAAVAALAAAPLFLLASDDAPAKAKKPSRPRPAFVDRTEYDESDGPAMASAARSMPEPVLGQVAPGVPAVALAAGPTPATDVASLPHAATVTPPAPEPVAASPSSRPASPPLPSTLPSDPTAAVPTSNPDAPAVAAAVPTNMLPFRAEDLPLTRPAAVPLEGSAEAGLDERTRFVPPARPDAPAPVVPPPSTEKNVDVGRPFLEWQRATGDWGGARPALEDRGVSLNAQLTADGSLALAGGANPRSGAYRQLFNANVTVDTERLAGLKGGKLYAQFQHQVGRDGSAVVGDAQGFSNIDADGRTQLSELWYEQSVFDGKLRAKVGKADANVDFGTTPFAGEFLNSSFGISPTLGIPTYPDPATGVVVTVTPSEAVYVAGGLFDGSGASGRKTGENGPASFLGSPAGVVLVGEAGYRWRAGADRLAGRVAVGGWHHTGDFAAFDGSTKRGTGGFYVLAEQQLFKVDPAKDEDARGVGVFAQFGRTDGGVSTIEWQAGAGVAWTGPVAGRDDDVLGLGLTYAG